ncbi:MAG: 3'(2'),5'-bisphosphate nucleotidase CysQ [Bacteroidota bacterium]
MHTLPSIDMTAVVAIAEAAGQRILEVYNRPDPIEVITKADDSPLTQADQASHEWINAELSRLFPKIPILSEEGGDIPYAERQNWIYCWQVDPLDGTKEFIKRNGEFAVNIALLHQGKAIAGVLHVPYLNISAWAQLGQGAYRRDADGRVYRLSAAAPTTREDFTVLSSRSHMREETRNYLDQLPAHALRAAGSAYKFILVAGGEAHLYPRLGPTSEWDTSAGQIIVEEAGGELLDADTGLPFTYNRKNIINNSFILYGKGVRKWIEEFSIG